MSHSVTVTRTTTTTTTSALIINSGYCKSYPGILKLLQLILGAVNVGLIASYYLPFASRLESVIFFLLIAVTFLIGTFLLLLSCLASISTASIIAKTIYEFIYHGFAFLLYLAASLVLLVEVTNNQSSHWKAYDAYFAAAVIGLVLCILYLISAVLAYRSYKAF